MFPADQPLGSNELCQTKNPPRFRLERAPAVRLQHKQTPAIVATRRHLAHEPVLFHALQRAVDRAWSGREGRPGRLPNRLHDRVACSGPSASASRIWNTAGVNGPMAALYYRYGNITLQVPDRAQFCRLVASRS